MCHYVANLIYSVTVIYIYIYIYIYMYIFYMYISNIQSASEYKGCGLFTYGIYKEFHLNL